MGFRVVGFIVCRDNRFLRSHLERGDLGEAPFRCLGFRILRFGVLGF